MITPTWHGDRQIWSLMVKARTQDTNLYKFGPLEYSVLPNIMFWVLYIYCALRLDVVLLSFALWWFCQSMYPYLPSLYIFQWGITNRLQGRSPRGLQRNSSWVPSFSFLAGGYLPLDNKVP
ncbi:hypothetical protein PVAP13_5KG294507 [Panicum virgatum]|uniref:Uncharacterized protein n=1 Tax=Panicum virgatum TaxID=38727 RepID=A0A8T0SNI4_PANVG|nr:hypothetical protein PVAP13_5KG294507 [Panicum virgatum]